MVFGFDVNIVALKTTNPSALLFNRTRHSDCDAW